MKTLLDVLGPFAGRLSLGARREIGNRSPVPLAQRRGAWNVPGMGRADNVTFMESYGTDATVFPIVNRLLTAVGETQWKLWTRAEVEEDRKPIGAHAVLDLLAKPNRWQTGSDLLRAGQQHNELTGETNIVIGKLPGVAYPVDLYAARPDRLEPVTDAYELEGWVYRGPNGERVELDLTEIMRWIQPNPMDPWRGMGPIQALLRDLDAQRYSREWQGMFFQNSARPGGVIEVDRRLDDEEFNEMRDRWGEQHRGISKAHRVAIIEHGAKWVETSFSLRDLQMVELDGAARDKVLVAFGFPKAALGIVEDVNRANAEAGEYLFARWLTVPRLKSWRSMFNTQLLPLYGERIPKTMELDFVSPIPEDSEAAMRELEVKSAALMAMAGSGGSFDAAKVLDMLQWPDLGFKEAPPPTIVAPPGAKPNTEPSGPIKPDDMARAFGVDMAMRWEVVGEDDDNACEPCKGNHGKLYRNREDAYADYPGGKGYLKCVGAEYGNTCRCTVKKRRGR